MLKLRCYSLGARYLAAATVPMATPPAMTATCRPTAAAAVATVFRPLMNEEVVVVVLVFPMMEKPFRAKHI